MSSKTLWSALTAPVRWVSDRIGRRRGRPPAGVREPRRPKPTLPAAAVALTEAIRRRWMKLTSRESELTRT